ncbi:MAG: hypothetical protein LC746_00220 [Acidobacteria bacterium]|nr:hypothetical protein [Acidobacteriota bacterium]
MPRANQPKKDTSHMVTRTPGGFVENLWLECRLALRNADPAKYLRATVERYAELKALSGVVFSRQEHGTPDASLLGYCRR